jgi:hypothetical protein
MGAGPEGRLQPGLAAPQKLRKECGRAALLACAAEGNACARFDLRGRWGIQNQVLRARCGRPYAGSLGMSRRGARFRVNRTHRLDERPGVGRRPGHGATVLPFAAAARGQFRFRIAGQYRYNQRKAKHAEQQDGRKPSHSGIIVVSRVAVK